MKILVFLFVLLVVSCQQLPIDRIDSAKEHGLFNIELHSCNKTQIGMLGCIIPKENLENYYLEIPTGLTGSYLIRSNKCNFRKEGAFSNKEIVKISYKELLANRGYAKECLYDIKIFIDNYPKSFRGLFKLTDLEDFQPIELEINSFKASTTAMLQYRTGLNPATNFVFKYEEKGLFILDGCGIHIEEDYNTKKEINFKILVPEFKKTCNFVVGMIPINAEIPPGLFSLTVNRFNQRTQMISKPRIWFKGSKFALSFEHAVSHVLINQKLYTFTCGGLISCKGNKRHKIYLEYDPNMLYEVRMFTTNGRYNLFKYKKGALVWKTNSIIY